MLLSEFVLENTHFALNLFAALVFFFVSWLYWDAWTQTKSKKELIKITGFLLLSISFLVHAVYIEQPVFINSSLNIFGIDFISEIIKFAAYLALILGLVIDPLQKNPDDKKQSSVSAVLGFSSISAASVLSISFPVLSFILLIFYLRRSTVGLEKHLKPLSLGFFFIFLYEFFSLHKVFESVNTISVYSLVKPFGPVWILAHTLLLVGIVVIAKWVFGYLLKRLQTEIFIIFNTSILVIFLVTTLSFTGLLVANLQQDALSHLSTDVSVVQYAVGVKKAQALSDAEVVAENPDIQKAILKNDRTSLKQLTTSILIAKKQSLLVVVATNGAVLMRGEDNEKIGDSISNDPLFVRALRGEKTSSVVAKDGPIAPTVSIRSAVPVGEGNQITGVVIVGTDIDNAFMDGLKSTTKLDVSVYGGNVLSATTFIAEDGKSRYVGVREEDKNINKNVLIEGKTYSGQINILNVPYFAVFSPLKDIDGNPAGMLFVGKEQISVIQAASNSIEYTFVLAAILLLISVFPSYLISKFISKQFN